MPTVVTKPIYIDDDGVAWIEGTGIKVIEVVLDKIALGLSPEDMHEEHPHWSLAQIHAALSYYYDHKEEVADINRRRRWVKEMQAQATHQFTRHELEARRENLRQ
ncbi:MAG: DUF433 domain-containing protein [Abitibacteriaceae bacterium]|nr:DUF433 domain-containing protein [Abditibacteriaceae bacterium]